MATSLIIGWLLDLLFGDPENLPHPIVMMGRWISKCEKKLNKGPHKKAKGAFFAVFSIVIVFVLTLVIIKAAEQVGIYLFQKNNLPQLCNTPRVLVESILIFYCLAGHTLRKEVKIVFVAVDESIDKGRQQIARIVGRDTNTLSAQEIRTAALETLAENLSDGVIAPLFWYATLGVQGMLAYKMINTMDSMIGYKNEKYKDYGCWAAHIDDIANYLPARITSATMIIACKLRPKWNIGKRDMKSLIKFVTSYGPKHSSPNSGWPEAALAGILDCQFGGTHNYFGKSFYKPYIGDNPRTIDRKDLEASIKVCLLSEIISIMLILLIFIGLYKYQLGVCNEVTYFQ